MSSQAGAVFSAGSSLLSGISSSRSMDAQAKASEYEARGLKLQGKQMGAERARELNDILGTIDAIRSSRSVSLDSPTAMVIERERKNRAATVEGAEQLEIGQAIVSKKYGASQLRKGAKMALIGSVFQAAGSLASGFAPK